MTDAAELATPLPSASITQSTALSLPQNVPEEDSRRNCWVCYASDEDDLTASWVKPCQCRGTTKWVHQLCLQRWVDEKQKGNSSIKVNCPQCGMQYIICFPNMGELMQFLDRMDAFIYKVCPFVAAGVVVGSCYWVAVTYGAITVMQVVGYSEGMAVMESADPFILLVGLPIIPVFLILGKMLRWEDKVLRFLRTSVRKLPILQYVLPGFRPDGNESGRQGSSTSSTTAVISDPINATRVLCGALSLPTIATLAGRALFPSCSNTLTQTILGGISFLVVKGLFKVYFKQRQHVMQSQRIIKDYPHHNQPPSSSTAPSSTTAASSSASSSSGANGSSFTTTQPSTSSTISGDNGTSFNTLQPPINLIEDSNITSEPQAQSENVDANQKKNPRHAYFSQYPSHNEKESLIATAPIVDNDPECIAARTAVVTALDASVDKNSFICSELSGINSNSGNEFDDTRTSNFSNSLTTNDANILKDSSSTTIDNSSVDYDSRDKVFGSNTTSLSSHIQ